MHASLRALYLYVAVRFDGTNKASHQTDVFV